MGSEIVNVWNYQILLLKFQSQSRLLIWEAIQVHLEIHFMWSHFGKAQQEMKS